MRRWIIAKLHTRSRLKKQTLPAKQTFCFNLPSFACKRVSANVTNPRGKRSLPPRPFPQSGRAEGIPGRGRRPLGANLFRLLFRSLGKVDPAEQITNNYWLRKFRSKTSNPLRSKKQTISDYKESKVKLQISTSKQTTNFLRKFRSKTSKFHYWANKMFHSITSPAEWIKK